MKKAKKFLLAVLALMLVVALSVAATLAFLTDKEDVKNTFTVGDVDITLDEKDIRLPAASPRRTDTGNDYESVLPGQSFVKDPVVTVKKGSTDCYVRLVVTVKYDEGEDLLDYMQDRGLLLSRDYKMSDFLTGINETDWTYSGYFWGGDAGEYTKFADVVLADYSGKGTVDGTDVIFTYADFYPVFTFNYKEVVPASAIADADLALPALFTGVTIPTSADKLELSIFNNMEIRIEAQAIQATGFDSADAAWAAFEAQQ